MKYNNINTQSPKVPMRNIYLFKQSELKLFKKIKSSPSGHWHTSWKCKCNVFITKRSISNPYYCVSLMCVPDFKNMEKEHPASHSLNAVLRRIWCTSAWDIFADNINIVL